MFYSKPFESEILEPKWLQHGDLRSPLGHMYMWERWEAKGPKKFNSPLPSARELSTQHGSSSRPAAAKGRSALANAGRTVQRMRYHVA